MLDVHVVPIDPRRIGAQVRHLVVFDQIVRAAVEIPLLHGGVLVVQDGGEEGCHVLGIGQADLLCTVAGDGKDESPRDPIEVPIDVIVLVRFRSVDVLRTERDEGQAEGDGVRIELSLAGRFLDGRSFGHGVGRLVVRLIHARAGDVREQLGIPLLGEIAHRPAGPLRFLRRVVPDVFVRRVVPEDRLDRFGARGIVPEVRLDDLHVGNVGRVRLERFLGVVARVVLKDGDGGDLGIGRESLGELKSEFAVSPALILDDERRAHGEVRPPTPRSSGPSPAMDNTRRRRAEEGGGRGGRSRGQ
mmetsp:Transcript_36421/g.109366  ORF Transcript_36421/g.109366 Transcript_36421/m.109366 type:complete len:302 (+) Transcript_36421:649-1554(+)